MVAFVILEAISVGTTVAAGFNRAGDTRHLALQIEGLGNLLTLLPCTLTGRTTNTKLQNKPK